MERGDFQYLPFGQYEFVTVNFPVANTEVVIPYQQLKPSHAEDVRWVDVTPGSVYSAGENHARVFRSGNTTRMSWAPGYVVLMSTVANYSTRLLLFVERI